MALHSSVPPPSQQPAAGASTSPSSASALESQPISPTARGTGVQLSIPLDREDTPSTRSKTAVKPPKRDSLDRRELVLKGKEGSRRRQRWENDRFLHVPNAQAPLPGDWEVRPTWPVHAVPYYLAPLYEQGVRRRVEERAAAAARKGKARGVEEGGRGRVPQELKHKMKKSKGAKSLLQDLEEEVRAFVKEWEAKEKDMEEQEVDSEDEEIVFVGRNGTMSDEQRKTLEEQLEREKLVFDSLADDHGASFGRWLVHSIATYYGLSSRSITVGHPARREAYVGIKEMKTGRRLSVVQGELPRPLWGMV